MLRSGLVLGHCAASPRLETRHRATGLRDGKRSRPVHSCPRSALQAGWSRYSGRHRTASFTRIWGFVLVLGTLNSNVLPQRRLPDCGYGAFAAGGSGGADSAVRQLIEIPRNGRMVDLIFRFMAGVGLILGALAIWDVVRFFRCLRSGWLANSRIF